MQYDITSKFIAENGKESLYRFFQKQEAENLELIQGLPQEFPDIKKGDFMLKVKKRTGEEEILIWEFKTRWNVQDVQNLMAYTLLARQRYTVPVKPVMFLFLQDKNASGDYEDDRFTFHFELIKMWEQDGDDILNKDDFYLYPFIPLMSGEDVILKAEEKLYNSVLDQHEKSELLSAMSVFAGLRSKDLSVKLFQRRRDIMIESYAYEVFREDAYKTAKEDAYKQAREDAYKQAREEVSKACREEGLREGLEKGLQEAIELALDIKFGEEGLTLIPRIKAVNSLEKLEEIKSIVRTAKNFHEVESVL